jgi:hypothetical protein
LTVTGNAAATLVHLADRLATALPATRAALQAGRIDLPKARVICDAVDGLTDQVAERIEASVLPLAPQQTTGQLRRRAKRAVQRLAPEAFQDRTQQTVTQRRLEVWDSVNGTAGLGLLDIATGDAHAIHNKITAVARAVKTDGDDRSLDQIRADLATQLLRGNPLPDAVRTLLTHTTPTPPRSQVAPRADEVVPASQEHGTQIHTPVASTPRAQDADAGMVQALAVMVDRRLTQMLAQARATGRMHALPALTAQAAQHLHDRLADLRDTRCQGSGDGNHGEHGYRPSAGLRRLIEARHPTCVFPTCNRRADRCDLDHTVPYDAHGPTCGCNLAPLCRRHHRTKQSPGWRLFQVWPGLLVWITPSGKWRIILPSRE